MRDFRKLNIWEKSIEVVNKGYQLSNQLPVIERYGLCSQMTRAAVSISSNIAEECSRDSDKGFHNYLAIALGSSFELETQLEIVKLNFELNEDDVKSLIMELNQLQKRMNALKSKLKTSR